MANLAEDNAAGHDIAGRGEERTSPKTWTARVTVVSTVEARNGTQGFGEGGRVRGSPMLFPRVLGALCERTKMQRSTMAAAAEKKS
jgi:hypothetical protein